MAQSVVLQMLLKIGDFQQQMAQAMTTMQQSMARMEQQSRRGSRAMANTTKSAKGFAGAIDFLKKRIIGAGLFFAAFYQGLITFRKLIGDSVEELFDLDDALRRVQSITKESDESIARLKGQLLDLAKQGKLFDQSASEVADSMFSIAQAGFTSSDSLTLARLAAEGAAIGFTKADVAAQVLVGVLKAYDLPVSKARDVLDVLFQTVDTGIITFEDLATGLGKILSSAAALDVPLEEVSAAVATLTLRGFTADQAMTSLGRIMQTFIRPSQRAKKAAADLGIELSANTLASKGLIATMQEMFVAAGGDVNKFAELFDRIQSTRGAVSLFSDDGELLFAVLQDMGLATEGAGAAAEAMEERSKSLKFRLGILRSQALAVVTDALEPLMKGFSGVVDSMNVILAGKNPFFNFFADLNSLVAALVATFLFMRRKAIAKIIESITSQIVSLWLQARNAATSVAGLKAAASGLVGVMSALGPLLVFIGVFALSKFLSQMRNADGASRKMSEALDQFNTKLGKLRELGLPEDLLRVEELNLAKKDLIALVDDLVSDFAKAADDIDDFFGIPIGQGIGESLDRTIRSITSLGMVTDSELGKMRKDFENTVDQWIEGANLTSSQLTDLTGTFRFLRESAKTSAEAELFGIAADRLGEAASNASEVDRILENANDELTKFNEALGRGTLPAKDVKKAIDDWIKPISDAKGLMEDILGLTSEQDIILRALIAPKEVEIAKINAEIDDLKGQQFKRATELGIPLDDISESEDAILVSLGEQISALEDQKTIKQNIIDRLKDEQEIQDKIDENLQAQLDFYDLQAGKLPTIFRLSDENKRILAQIVRVMREDGVQGITDWITNFEAMGGVLDEEVGQALLDIVDNLGEDKNKLKIDVTAALNNLGIVRDQFAEMKRAFEQGLAIEGGAPEGFPGFQHGVRNFMGGLALVGELGPELVRLPRGSDVIPTNRILEAIRSFRPTVVANQPAQSAAAGSEPKQIIYVDELHLHGNAREQLESLAISLPAGV